MRVLITGGAGYVGSALAPYLVDCGHEVTVLDRLVFGHSFQKRRDGLQVYQGDVRDADSVHSLLRGQDAVVHLAFTSNDPAYCLNVDLAHAINIAPLEPLLAAAINAKVRRFVLLSSCSVYGRSDSIAVDETARVAPITDYARHKLACEAILARYSSSASLSCTALRPATLCGRAPRQRFDLLLNRMVAEGVSKGTITVSSPARLRPVLPISELVNVIGYLLSCPQDHVKGRIFNVAFENRSVADWAGIVSDILGNARVIVHEGDDSDDRSYNVTSERIRLDTGYVPKENVANSVGELASAICSGEFLNPFGDARWINLATQAQHDFAVSVPLRRVA